MSTSDFSMRGAVWITPFRSETFMGFSVTVDIDNSFEYDGNEYMEWLDKNKVYVSVASLVRLSDEYYLRAGIRTYNMQGEDPFETRFDNSKLFSDGIFIGLLDSKRRTLELGADNSYGVLYSLDKHDTLTISLRYAQGESFSHMRHILFWGIKADAGASFLSRIGEDVGTFAYAEYLRNLTAEGWILRAKLALPVIFDASIAGPLRCMVSVGPQIAYTQINNNLPQHKFAMTLPHAELSLRGTISRQFDFAFKPTISNDVFISALEIRYRF